MRLDIDNINVGAIHNGQMGLTGKTMGLMNGANLPYFIRSSVFYLYF